MFGENGGGALIAARRRYFIRYHRRVELGMRWRYG
jgi:hypothetical protein